MSEYSIHDKHDKEKKVSRLLDLGNDVPQEKSQASWGTIIFIGALIVNLLSWIFVGFFGRIRVLMQL